jgi:hypothetical protein
VNDEGHGTEGFCCIVRHGERQHVTGGGKPLQRSDVAELLGCQMQRGPISDGSCKGTCNGGPGKAEKYRPETLRPKQSGGEKQKDQ